MTNLTIRSLAVSALLFVASAAVFAQVVNPARVKVNGVGLGSTYSSVIKALGKPTKDGKPISEDCAGGREKTVEYQGLSFTFMDGDSRDRKTFEVIGFEISSPKWTASGVRVGDTEAMVKRKFGKKFRAEPDPDTGGTTWTYEMGENDDPGWTTFTFKGGKVVSFGSGYMVC